MQLRKGADLVKCPCLLLLVLAPVSVRLGAWFQSKDMAAVSRMDSMAKRKRMSGTEKNGPALELLKDSRGSSHGRRLSLSLSSLSLSGEILNHSYSMCSSSSSSNSPPWSPYCSPATKSQVTIPFSWEDKPGVPKHHKTPTPHRSLPLPPQAEFSDAEAFQLERRPRRRTKKRSNDVDPFVSALVECTKQQQAAAAAAMSKDGRAGPRKQGYYGYGAATYSCIKSCAVTTDAQIAIPSRARQSSKQSSDDDDWTIKKQNALAIIASDHRRHRSHERLLYYEADSDSAKFLHSDPKQLQRSERRDMVPHKRQLRPAFMESWDLELHKTLVL